MAFEALLAAFQQRGFLVVLNDPRCSDPLLHGFYERLARRIVICPRGNRNETLLHEGWHAVQSRCLKGKPMLSDGQLEKGLTRMDRKEMGQLYDPSKWRREAEARVMARVRVENYFAIVDQVCQPVAAAQP